MAGMALAVAVATAATTALTTGSAHAAGNCSNGYVGITYDDGPGGTTTQLLSVLKANGVRATLFNIGQNAAANPSLVAQEQAAGMWIGNHSYTHSHMTSMSSSTMTSELQRTQQAITSGGGTAPKIFRPPYGEHNSTLDSAASALGLRTVTWDVDSQDWNGASTSAIVQAASTLQNGGVILMHDQYQTTRDAVPQIMANLNSRGLCPGMISPSTGRAVAPDGTTPTTPVVTTPVVTTPVVTTPVVTTPVVNGACSATYTQIGAWTGGFQGQVTVKAGSSAINSWTVGMTLASGQAISSLWSGTASGTSGSVTVKNASYNGSLGAGASTTFGFTGTTSGSTAAPTVTCSTP